MYGHRRQNEFLLIETNPRVSRLRHEGFTLVETLAAAVILAASVVVLCSITTRCMNQTSLHEDYDQAWSVLDRQLKTLDVTGVNKLLLEGKMEGTYDSFGRPFGWKITISDTDTTGLYEVAVTVNWEHQRQPHTIETTTWFYNDAGAI